MSDTRVVIAGVCGRMGQALVSCSGRMQGLKVTGALEYSGHPSIGRDAGEVAGVGAIGVNVCADISAVIQDCDAVIDFTLHDAVPGNVIAAEAAGKAVVIGTTGLDASEAAVVRKCSEKIPIVWAPNMSLGVNLLFSALKKAGEVLGAGYSVEIDETHHVHKKDAPSGTALGMGRKVAEGMGVDFDSAWIHDEEGRHGLKEHGKIVIRSYRKGEVVGDHTVSFESPGERIEFTHHAWNREAFAAGALRAAQWVKGRRPGMYDMQAVLGL